MRQVAFGWLGVNEQTSTGTRVRVARMPTPAEAGAYAFTFDQLASQPIIDSATADTLLRTAMFVGGPDTTCDLLLPRLGPILNSQPLRLVRAGPGGADFGMVRNLDGIYGGEQADGAVAVDIAGVPEDPFTLTIPAGGSAIVDGFAVWVDLAMFYPDVTVTRSQSPLTFTYRLQRVPGRTSQVVLWFPEGMETGDVITIDPVP
jgi:hypothetical protein